jgi:hypothetical protein
MYIWIETKVEIVQLNLNSGGMRVRWTEPEPGTIKGFSVQSQDVPIGVFYEQYDIVKKSS